MRLDNEGYLLGSADWTEEAAEERGHGANARKRLFELFPYGYVKQACRIGGTRRPRIWSTG